MVDSELVRSVDMPLGNEERLTLCAVEKEVASVKEKEVCGIDCL